MFPNRAAELLRGLLALLRAQYWHYQNAHWTVKGTAYYGDHLMFQRIYEGIAKEIDALAEKCVAHFNGDVVNPESLAALMQGWLRQWSEIDCLHERSLRSESDFQAAVKAIYDLMKADGSLSLGIDDFLMAMANDHETHTYLVQQVLRGRERMASLEDAWRVLGKEHPSEEARRKYLKQHPKADPKQEGFEALKGLSPGKQRQVIERALRMAHLEDVWGKRGAPLGGWSAEMTPLEKTWGGYSSFRPIRRGEDSEDDSGFLEDNDLLSMWFKIDNDEGFFRPAPQWSQLQDWAGEGEAPVLDETPFSGWTLSKVSSVIFGPKTREVKTSLPGLSYVYHVDKYRDETSLAAIHVKTNYPLFVLRGKLRAMKAAEINALGRKLDVVLEPLANWESTPSNLQTLENRVKFSVEKVVAPYLRRS